MAKTITSCATHKPYATAAQAENARLVLVNHVKKTGQGGTSYKRLEVFPCADHWHVGRGGQKYVKAKRKTANAPYQQPTYVEKQSAEEVARRKTAITTCARKDFAKLAAQYARKADKDDFAASMASAYLEAARNWTPPR